MQTAREYLVGLGLAKPERGRFSLEGKAQLTRAISQGMKFSDWDENGRIKQTAVIRSTVESRIVRDSGASIKHPTPNKVRLELVKDDPVAPVKINVTPIQRTENAISLVDDRGTKIVIGHCKNMHVITRCTCKNPSPADWLNATKFELVTV